MITITTNENSYIDAPKCPYDGQFFVPKRPTGIKNIEASRTVPGKFYFELEWEHNCAVYRQAMEGTSNGRS